MKSFIFLALLFACCIIATTPLTVEKKDENTAIHGRKPAIFNDIDADDVVLELLHKRDEIDDWNNAHQNNRVAGFYVCPDVRALYTVFNSLAVWEAFCRGVWYHQHPNEDRPRWSGLEYPHSIYLPDYHARQVDMGEAHGELFAFPLQPGEGAEWPGVTGSPVFGPPGDHRVLFDGSGMFAGVAIILRGEPDGERLVWCYPILEHGDRDFGATAEGNPGVDEAWIDDYSGHFLYAPDPAGGSRPPPR
ncbi:hypothetical protein F4818DRAFT_149867 [Hypoxylon cercidicola]|nr:hypothetical protein F4818DRAFT_149867 [Hypoxylon cercidicola]